MIKPKYYILCLLGIVMIGGTLSACTDHEAEWLAYKSEHSCTITSRTAGHTSYTSVITNNGVQMIPFNEYGVSTYKCDNGTVSRREQ